MSAITTCKVNCLDCHRCVRSCPVKAIGINQGQAVLIEDKCVLCGKCVVECPQKAKQVVTQIDAVKYAISAGRRVVLSLAPSFAAAFSDNSLAQLVDKILELGFSAVEETAVGAEVVSCFYAQMLKKADKPVISACCPVVVNVIKKYYPQLVANLAPVVSPMQAHARLLKHRYGADTMVVFAGPCIAKIAEKDEKGSQVEAVITFEELKTWLGEGSLVHRAGLPVKHASARARHYPVVGGILNSFTRSEYTAANLIAVDGLTACIEVFAGLLSGDIAPAFIEALACSHGCINGPVNGTDKCSPAKRLRILEFAAHGTSAVKALPADIDFRREHREEPYNEYIPGDEEIIRILERTGKYSKDDEKNCGGCGFSTCREKAIAVCQGLTTIETCVPYMRSKAESFGNIIVDNSIDAIIVVNTKMVIEEFNPAAEALFGCGKERMKGRRLTDIMDCSQIIAASKTGGKVTDSRVEVPATGAVTSQMIIPVLEHDLILIVLTDITLQEKQAQEAEIIKRQTVEKASEIIKRQMQVAQEIAGLLGETTAETKAALLEVMGLLKETEDR
jgi:iron only hydrogenase large subunit-like protein